MRPPTALKITLEKENEPDPQSEGIYPPIIDPAIKNSVISFFLSIIVKANRVNNKIYILAHIPHPICFTYNTDRLYNRLIPVLGYSLFLSQFLPMRYRLPFPRQALHREALPHPQGLIVLPIQAHLYIQPFHSVRHMKQQR